MLPAVALQVVLKEGAAALVGAAKNRPVASVGWAVVEWAATTVVGGAAEVAMAGGMEGGMGAEQKEREA